MSGKTLGTTLIVVGAIAFVLSVAANPLQLGANPREFGWLQTLGTILGLVVAFAGFRLRGGAK